MANILAVRLENFQSHLDTLIEFNKGLNVIVGQSDSGKTAILRGIRWALYNQPRGSDFIRVGADFVRVTVTFDHGLSIIRERTSSKNRYIIRNGEGEDLVLEGFGVHVPNEVLEAHGMNHLRIDHDTELEVHLSQQLDGPFLLEQTSSARAKTLGRISGAHFLDMAIRDTTRDLSQLNQRLKQEQEEIERLKERLTQYDPLDEMKTRLDQTEHRITEMKRIQEKRHQLNTLKQDKERLTLEMQEAKKEKELVSDVDKWANHLERLQDKGKLFIVYEKKRSHYEEVEKAINVCKKWINKTEHVSKALGISEQIEGKLSLFKKLERMKAEQQRIRQTIENEKRQWKRTTFLDDLNFNQFESISMKQETYLKLTMIQQRIIGYSKEKQSIVSFIGKLPHIEMTKEQYEKVEDSLKRRTELKQTQMALLEIERRIKDGERYIEAQKITQAEAEARLEERLLAEGTCPTCGQAVCIHEGR